MTNSSRALRHAVRFTLAAVASTASASLSLAQTAPATSAPSPSLQEIVVTGSRIQQLPNEVSISPITSVTALDIQQTGLTRTEDLLNNLPQVVAEQSSSLSISNVCARWRALPCSSKFWKRSSRPFSVLVEPSAFVRIKPEI